MRSNQPSSHSHSFQFITTIFGSLFRRGLRRRLVCLILIINLLVWPAPIFPGLNSAFQQIPMLASLALGVITGSSPYPSVMFNSLFSSAAASSRQETLADRLVFVSQLQLSPRKQVGYRGQHIFFSALPTDFAGRTIQGITYSWSSSDPGKVSIDQSGRARLISPGLAWITCRAGSVERRAAVLVRPGNRPRQTDQQWIEDQRQLREDGTIASGPGSTTSIASLIPTLLNKLVPTAHAQDPTPAELFYDQMWSEPRNQVGSPPIGVIESTRTGTILPEGSNFNLAIPIIPLGGRGIGANVTLYNNTCIWTRRDTRVAFDPIAGWPAPGFTLGFGRVVTYDVATVGGQLICKYMFIESDGTRRYLGSGLYNGTGYATGGPYETTDGSHIVYVGNALHGGTIYYPDGTRIGISLVNNRLLATHIMDNNGNFVQITYMPECFEEPGGIYCGYYRPEAIDYVTDTLGRVIDFNYDSNYKLASISAPAYGGTSQNPLTRTLVRFDYQNLTLSYNFSGLTVELAPQTNRALKHIYFPATGTGYLMSYSQYGMIYSFSARRQMPDVTQSGVESNNVTFNYPTSGSTVLTDVPAFTQRTETATDSPSSIYTYSKSENIPAQTMTFTITQPDSSQLLLTRSTNSSSPANGRLTQTEVKNSSGVTFSKTDMTYVNDGGNSPQVQSITSYNDQNQPTKVEFDHDQYGNVTDRREYGFQVSGAWQVRRQTRTTYNTDATYINNYLRGLPTLVEVLDPDDNVIAKTSYTYDDYQAMGGMEMYDGQPNPPGYSGPLGLGNVTGTKEWIDIAADTFITRLRKFDKFGNVIKEQTTCCDEKSYTCTQTSCWSQPEQVTSGNTSGIYLTNTAEYDFNTGAAKNTKDPNNLQTTYSYDTAMRYRGSTIPAGASSLTSYDDGQLSSSSSVSYDDGGVNKTITSTAVYDGWGRVIRSVDGNGAQVNTTYDAMGRAVSRTNPFPQGGTPGPVTTYQYDTLGRVTVTTLPGGNTVTNTYSGSTVTVTDQVNRKIKRESDGLGRLVKVIEQDAAGALTQETIYSYNLLDKLLQVNQGGQFRSYKYDALGRLLYEKIPEQTPTIDDGTGAMWTMKYVYNTFHAVVIKTDPRGVETHYKYDNLHRLIEQWYTGLGGDEAGTVRPALPSTVGATPNVFYNYDNNQASASTGMLASVYLVNSGGGPPLYEENYS